MISYRNEVPKLFFTMGNDDTDITIANLINM